MNGVPKDTKPHLTYNFIMNILNISCQDFDNKYEKKKKLDTATLHAKRFGPKLFAQAENTGGNARKKTSKIKSKIKKTIVTSTVEEKNIPQDTYQKLIDELRFLQPQ